MPEEIIFPFEQAEAYQHAMQLARECRGICRTLPKGYNPDSDELKRASLSVCNNIAEGYGRWHVKEKQNFYGIARGSAYECVPVISLLCEERQITNTQNNGLRQNIADVTRMLSAMIQGVGKRI
jgi:four helix bundle protein